MIDPPVYAIRPTIAAAAAAVISAATRRYGSEFEVAFRAEYDHERQLVTQAVPVFFGNKHATRLLQTQFRYGELALHSHPLLHTLTPSDADLDAAVSAAAHGVAFGIVNPAGTELFLVTSPADVAIRSDMTPETRRRMDSARHWSRTIAGRTVSLTVYPADDRG